MKTGSTYDPIAAEFLMRELRADFKTAMQRFKARDRYRKRTRKIRITLKLDTGVLAK